MASVAESSVAARSYDLGADVFAPQALRTARSARPSVTLERVAKPYPEEPDAGNPHVRICGGPGR